MRDIVPDLHRDGRFTVYREGPGELRLSDKNFEAGEALDAEGPDRDWDDVADPDEWESKREEADEPALADVLARGTDAEAPIARGQRSARVELALSHRLKVRFRPDREDTRVTISGSADHDVCSGLERLGRPDHWPAIAARPHD